MLFQIDTTAFVEELITPAEEPIQESINLWEMAQYGGWIMIILAILLAAACYIFIARLVVIKQATREDKSADGHPVGTHDRERYHAYRSPDAGRAGSRRERR